MPECYVERKFTTSPNPFSLQGEGEPDLFLVPLSLQGEGEPDLFFVSLSLQGEGEPDLFLVPFSLQGEGEPDLYLVPLSLQGEGLGVRFLGAYTLISVTILERLPFYEISDSVALVDLQGLICLGGQGFLQALP